MQMTMSFPGGLAVNAEYAGFTIRTDQPVTAGGAGGAPSPFDLFVASLGTCAGYYVMRFLRNRGLSLDGVSLTLDAERAEDGHLLSTIRVDVTVPEDFPWKYRRALVGAVDACTVKRHLKEPPSFETRIHVTEHATGGP
jgi:ribosomal protein S12 methylthiotransferase accessory factor